MGTIIALLSLGVVAVIIKNILMSGSTGTNDITAIGGDVTGFYKALSMTNSNAGK